MIYGCETLTVTKKMTKKLEPTETWFWRKVQQMPWTDRKKEGKLLKEASEQWKLVKMRREGQPKFLGHAMRKQKLENLEMIREFRGERKSGRSRETYRLKKKAFELIGNTKTA